MDIVSLLWTVRRKLHLSAMQLVLRELNKRKVSLKSLDALEIYGGSGASHTMDYASQVKSFEVWEIAPKFEMLLRQNLPMAEVKIVDSYKEIKNISRKYNLIVVDNPESTFGEHCEHFDLLPDIFHVAEDSSILILNVIPEINDFTLKWSPNILNEVHVACRKSFYKTNSPKRIYFDLMVQTYEKLIIENGFKMEWYFFLKRAFTYFYSNRKLHFVYYLVLKIKKG